MKHLLKSALAVLLLFCVLLPFTSCSKKAEEVPEGMQIANVPGDTFRLYVPLTWNVNSGSGTAGAFYISSGTSAVNVTHMTSEAESADAFLDECTAEYIATFDGRYEVVQTDTGTFGGENAKLRSFKVWTEEDVNYSVLQVVAKHEGEFYLFTFSATRELYEKCYTDVEKMISEFRFAEAYVPEKTGKKISDAKAPAGMKTASDDRVPYRFYVPESWTVDMTTDQTAAFTADRSNVSVTVYEPKAEVMTLDAYFDYCMNEYKTYLTELTIVSRTTDGMTMGGKNAQVWEFTAKIGGEVYHFRQTVIPYNSLFFSGFYTLTYTATEENYIAHLSDVDAMVDAFVFR